MWTVIFIGMTTLNAALFYDDPNPWSCAGMVAGFMLFVANLWEER